ncbi:unnamed protein product [Effrenium voratum]|nr:unnamed protein product [Effrenium voratum]
MPSATLSRGQLVEITGLKAPVATPERWRRDGADRGAQDVNGQQGQVIEFNEESGEWTVATFTADIAGA